MMKLIWLLIGCVVLIHSTSARQATSQADCGMNETYTDCGSCVEDICGQPKIYAKCFACTKGCFCNEDYIRGSRGGTCIPKCKCSKLPK
ncbi:chymotrypsin-elastase inhibitor ixodidin-like [Uranotaenia lowii]|uniref:chymotrypsin-elastase inhibitor ixodidin-like n=1 Tax=Uranotaenia lowii TaxID=190385 RepID=UPI002478B17E|nr:chymotrypsin-elastase inhibitor ixodidin-like [Uranotaenia lowii]